MLRNQIILLFVFLVAFASSFSQTYTAAPDWVKTETVKGVGEVNSKNIQEGYYYVLVDEQIHTVLQHNFYHYATKVVSEIGLDHATQIEINYDPAYQKVQVHYIRIYRGEEVLDRTRSAGLKELKEETERGRGVLKERRTLYANLSDVRKGDIVEYAYSVIGYNKIFRGYFSYNLWLGYSVPVGKINRSLVVDNNARVSILNKNGAGKPEISRGKYTAYTWVVNNAPVVKTENNIPSWFDPSPVCEVSNCPGWQEVKRWSKSLFETGKYDDSDLKALADSVKNQHSDKEEQITAMVNFVQDQIRYSGNTSGIYSHQPHLPDYVFRNRYGDCKDKSLFLKELLKQIEVKSYPVLLDTEEKGSVSTSNPSVQAFNHCILAIQYEDSLYFIDPTDNLEGGGFRKRGLPDYEAVMVLDDQENVFTKITPDTAGKMTVIENFTIDDETRDADLTVQTTYTGSQADQIRYTFANNSLADMQDNYRLFYLKYSDEVEVMDTLTFEDDLAANEFSISEHYLLKDFWISSDSASTKIEKDFMPYVLNDRISYVTDKVRKQPMALTFPVNVSQIIRVHKTGGWNIDNGTVLEDNKFFYYLYNTAVNDKLLTLEYAFRTKVSHVKPEDYLEYKSKADFVDHNMVLSVISSDANDKVFGFNWLLVTTTVVSTVLAFFICIQLYKRPHASPFEKRYGGIGGWLILVGIGLIVTPVSLLYQVIQLYKDEMGVDYFYFYFSEESRFYEPLKGYYALFSNFGNMFLIISSIFLLVVFFQRKSSFRIYYAGFRIFNLVFLLIDLALIYAFADTPVSHEDQTLIKTQAGDIGKMVVQAAIWIPYVLYSERSKYTFAVGSPAGANAEQTPGLM